MRKLLVINGSYRDDGIIDQAISVAVSTAERNGFTVTQIQLRSYPINFCLNCRECTQSPGDAPGRCIQNDGMRELIVMIEDADALIFASPTNFSSVTAVFKRFMERLVVYAYWPWGKHAPEFRRKKPTKKALLLTSCAAPGILSKLSFNTMRQLNYAAKTVGAKSVARIHIGLSAGAQKPRLPKKTVRRVSKAVTAMLTSV